jgi:hypothetical protein
MLKKSPSARQQAEHDAGDLHAEQPAEGVGQQMPFSALIFLWAS